jgi:hypothetical protein
VVGPAGRRGLRPTEGIMASAHDDAFDEVALDTEMFYLGQDVTYCAYERNPRTITAVVGDEQADDIEGALGVQHRRVRMITFCTDSTSDWSGIAVADLNLKDDYFILGDVDDMNESEAWKAERVMSKSAHAVSLMLVFSEYTHVRRAGLNRRG